MHTGCPSPSSRRGHPGVHGHDRHGCVGVCVGRLPRLLLHLPVHSPSTSPRPPRRTGIILIRHTNAPTSVLYGALVNTASTASRLQPAPTPRRPTTVAFSTSHSTQPHNSPLLVPVASTSAARSQWPRGNPRCTAVAGRHADARQSQPSLSRASERHGQRITSAVRGSPMYRRPALPCLCVQPRPGLLPRSGVGFGEAHRCSPSTSTVCSTILCGAG